MLRILFGLSLVFGLSAANASIVTWTFSDEVIEGVTLAPSGEFTLGKRTFTVLSIGAGVRAKQVDNKWASLYVSELFGTDPDAFSRKADEALHSLDDMDAVAMRLSWLVAVPGEKIQELFFKAFTINKETLDSVGLDVQKPPLSDFLATMATDGGVEAGQALVVMTRETRKGEQLVFESADGKVFKFNGPKGLTRAFFACWLGKPADEGLQRLKEQLINGR